MSGKLVPRHLCDSARPVPAAIPKGTKYIPSSALGADVNTGDAEAGWQCLELSTAMPIDYRYPYDMGSGYLVPSISPRPGGYEASAQGDLDGDGVPSTFAVTRTIGPDGAIQSLRSIHIDNQHE